MPIEQQILILGEGASTTIHGIRDQEPDATELALSLAITGVRGLEFSYELTFIPFADAGEDDVLWTYGELPVVVRADSVERLRGAEIKVGDGGLGIDNPNSPVPKIDTDAVAAGGPVAERLAQILNESINPAIAAHGGFAELVAVEGDTAYVRLGGGCQGCGLAKVTLSQGIEVAIKNAVPEILNVVDVTDHSSGSNPYYEAAKK